MPTYGKNNFKESNVNYLNKDFGALKTSLMNYAKSYFPDTYRDFNETSPGMMLLEMNAYVGDVLSFYIDQQYKEMLLPLAEERRNIITMAKMFGYRVKPIVPSYVDLTFTSNVNVSTGDVSKVDYNHAGMFDAGIEVSSDTDSDIIFSTLEPIDFRITGSNDTETIGTTEASGLASTYTLSRTVKAVSATEKTITFQVGIPEKFKTITIPDTNVVDIISCVDSNNNNWYEVDFLAQDKVPIETHYTDDENRDSAYDDNTGLSVSEAVPFSLTYIKTSKRFTRETNQDNTTSLVFGNGVLKNGDIIDGDYIDMEQVGIIIPGQANNLNETIDPLLGDEYSTLGETPNNITLTITYRVGGGITSNVPSGNITTFKSTITPALGSSTLTSVINEKPAHGGKNQEDTIEIKERAKAFFSTQNRCVTKEDYEARVLNIPAKFGNIAKAYVARPVEDDVSPAGQAEFEVALVNQNIVTQGIEDTVDQFRNILDTQNLLEVPEGGWDSMEEGMGDDDPRAVYNTNSYYDLLSKLDNILLNTSTYRDLNETLNNYSDLTTFNIGTINIYLLGYNNVKQLVGNPHTLTTLTNDNLPNTLLSNLKNYLENFKLLTDLITLNDGYIVNFGVIFDVIAEKYANKQEVKFKCLQKIKDYFSIEKMQFNQPIFKSNLEFELMGIEGVRSIGHVTLTQYEDYNGEGESLISPTYRYSFSTSGGGADLDGNGVDDGSFISENNGTDGYGYKYDFEGALTPDGTVIVPPNIATPTVFELKNPNQNIQGRVR